MPMQQHNKAIRSAHAMIGMLDPEEPESTEPELAWEPEESPEVKESAEPEVKDSNDAEEAPLEPDEESHGVTVVVGAAVTISFALTAAAASAAAAAAALSFAAAASDVAAPAMPPANAAMPPANAAVPAAAPTPMPIFCSSVKPSFF